MKRLAPYLLDAVMVAVILATVIQCVRYAALCRNLKDTTIQYNRIKP